MLDWILDHESSLRLGVFLGLFMLMALLETLRPRRQRQFPRASRWVGNIGILVLASLLIRVLLPWLPVSVALYAEQAGYGLFQVLDLPKGVEIFLGVILLDLLIYAQHVAMHHVPILWRLHRLHHADLDYDVTTGIRFHPIEIFLSLFYKMGLVLILGVPAVAVVIFEVVLNGMAMFNHANFKLPLGLDRVLRLVFVTPDVHRVHHSAIMRETNSNYGFNLCLWDRLFGTYTAQPVKGHEDMTIGLETLRESKELRLDKMLLQPFKS